MATLSAPARAGFALASVGLHAIAFLAGGHGSAGAPSVSVAATELSIEEASPQLSPDNETAAPTVEAAHRRPTSPVMHTHSYPVPLDHDAHTHDPALVHVPVPGSDSTAQAESATSPFTETARAPMRFAMTIGGAPPHPVGEAATPGRDSFGVSRDPGNDGAPLREEGVSSPARAIGEVPAVYPPAARAAEVEADVVLSVVVTSWGQVTEARVLKGAGYGFDEAAVRAALATRFQAAQNGGRPVAVRKRWVVTFRLR